MQRLKKLKFGLMLRAMGLYKQLTLGARVAAFSEGKILLVRHGYVAGWHLPGGGVDPGETIETAARRELMEETGHEPTGPLRLFSVYHSTLYTNRDHVALFVVEGAQAVVEFRSSREICEIGWFDPDALPPDAGPATRRRLEEIAGRADISPQW